MATTRLPHLTLAFAQLPAGRSWWLPDMQAIVLTGDSAGRNEVVAWRTSWLTPRQPTRSNPSDTCSTSGEERRGDSCSPVDHDDQLVDALLCVMSTNLADELWVDIATVRTRLEGLTDREKDQIELMIAKREGAA